MLNKVRRYRPAVLIAIVIAFAVFAEWSTVTAPRRQNQGASQRNPGTDQLVTQEPQAIVKVLPDKEPAPNGTNLQNKTADDWTLSDKIAVIATLVGFLQFIALVGTILVMRKSGERQLRAYLGVRAGGIRFGFSENQQVVAWVDIPNSGQTTAHNVCRYFDVAVLEPDADPASAPQQPGSWAMVPQAYWTLRKTIDVTDTELSEITAEPERKTVFVWGKVTYDDVFGRQHTTEFRYKIWREVKAIGRDPLTGSQIHEGWGLDPTPTGNRAT